VKTAAIAVLLLATTVHAQETRKHKTIDFNAADYTAYGLVAAGALGDYLTTREGVTMHPAMIEHTLPAFVVQSPGRLAAYEFGTVLVVDGTAALFNRAGHPYIGRGIAFVAAAWALGNVARNINAIHTQQANQSRLVRY
jgi:hypothetical protein